MPDSVDLGSAHGKVEIDVSGVKPATQAAGHDMKQMGQSSMMASMDIQMAGMVVSAAGAVIALAFEKAAETAIDFDKNMRNVNSIAKLSETQFRATEKAVLDMSTRLPQTINELSEGLYDVYSSGFAGKTALEVLEIAATGASAGLTNTATSGKALMAVMNAYNEKTGPDAKRIMDIMFKTVDKGVLTFEQLAGSVGDFVSTTAAAKIPFKQAAAAIASMTLNGINANEAATALNQSILHMIRPTDEAAKMAESLGLKWFNMRDGAKHLQEVGLAKVLDEIRDATHGDIGAMAQLMPEVRGLKGLLSLTRNEGEDFNDMLVAMEGSAGSTQRALQEQSKATAYQLSILRNYADALATSVLLRVLPAFNLMLTGLGAVAEWLMAQPAWVRGLIAAYFALIGVIIIATGAMLTYSATMGIVTRGLAAMTAQSGLAAIAVRGLSLAFKLLGSLGVIITVLTAAWKAGEWLGKSFLTIRGELAVLTPTLIAFGVALAVALWPISAVAAVVAGLAAALVGLVAAWTKYGDGVKRWLGIETEQKQKAAENAEEIKKAEEKKRAAKEAAKDAAEQAAQAEAEQLRAEQLAAIARSALYISDEAARKALTDSIMASSKDQIKAFEDAQQKFYGWVGIFDELPKRLDITKEELTVRLQAQIDVMNQWAADLKTISGQVPGWVASELRGLGPAAAEQIAQIAQMSKPELDNYVELMRQKHAQATDVAQVELKAKEPILIEEGRIIGKGILQGMKEGIDDPAMQELLKTTVHGTVSMLGTQAHIDTAFAGGNSVGSAWTNGFVTSLHQGVPEIDRAMQETRAHTGGSLPEKGPLTQPQLGGMSIGQAWMLGIAEAIKSRIPVLSETLNMAIAKVAPIMNIARVNYAAARNGMIVPKAPIMTVATQPVPAPSVTYDGLTIQNATFVVEVPDGKLETLINQAQREVGRKAKILRYAGVSAT